jgi:hypothetical protein
MLLTSRSPSARRGAAAIALALVVGLLAGCSSSSSSDGSSKRSSDGASSTTSATPTNDSTTTPAKRPDGPGSSFKELTGGKGISLLAANPGPALKPAGYAETEYSASGTATAYEATDGLPTDGRFTLKPTTKADYATRMVVRRPTDPKKFNGTVVVEWLNVSSGADIAPDYAYMATELLRGGYAWVGVSAQRIGVEGGPVAVAAPAADITGAGKGIKTVDPARYGGLHHPGDAYSYDMYTQIGRGLRAAAADGPLAGLKPKQVLADGESQSAFALTTYADGVQPLTHAFDGFLIHSRGGAPAPLGTPGAGIDIAGSITGKPTRIRTDLRVPVLMVESETDVVGIIGYLPARQPDTDLIRTWEMAGTSHADGFQVGAAESILGCSTAVNHGQQHFVVAAALRSLDRWAAGGAAPPKAPRLDVDTSVKPPALRLDTFGNAKGGIRTPVVDAPLDVLSGLPPATGSSVICILFGRTIPLAADVVAKEFPTRQAYVDTYAKAADSAIRSGFVLADDRKALLAEAQPTRVGA